MRRCFVEEEGKRMSAAAKRIPDPGLEPGSAVILALVLKDDCANPCTNREGELDHRRK